MCRSVALDLGVGFISGQADVPRMSRDLKIGLEEAGRKARYAFFEQAARHHRCSRIATAHTRTDHVETVLHHLIRGSGLTGLAGIAEIRGELIRPLLPFSREETRAYVAEHCIPIHDDPANSDLSFARARIRHRIVPEIQAINPAAEEAVCRLAGLVSAEDRFLNGVAAAALESVELPLNGQLGFLTKDVEVAFQRARLSSLPDVVIRRAIRLAVETLGGQFDSHETTVFLAGLREQGSGSVTAIGGAVVVEWDGDKVHVRDLSAPAPFRFRLTVPGETISDELGWRFTALEAAPSGEPAARASISVELDPGCLQGEMFFRNAGPADLMRPLGFSGRRKLSDLMSEAKLTPAARARLPIVCDLVGPIWAPGICLDERGGRPGRSSKVTVLRFEPALPRTTSDEPYHEGRA